MLHLLFISEDTSKLLNKTFHYLELELSKIANVIFWRKSGHIQSILKQLPKKPDFIFVLNDIDQHFYPRIKGLDSVDIPVGLFINDVHRFTSIRREFIYRNNVPYLFTAVRDEFRKRYPEFVNKMIWNPYFINPTIFKDYQLEKKIDLLMMGAVNQYYPLRRKIIESYDGDPRFVYHRHPGYQSFNQEKEKFRYTGERYAKELNQAKIFFTCPSVLHYPVLKYFEALATNTLLLAPTFQELEDLGFIPNVHFVPISEHNFKEKASYYLQQEEKRRKIAQQGYEFMHQTHTLKKRAEALIQRIEKIISS